MSPLSESGTSSNVFFVWNDSYPGRLYSTYANFTIGVRPEFLLRRVSL